MRTLRMFTAPAIAGAMLALVLASSPQAQESWTVVMSGLNNPRGLTFARVTGPEEREGNDGGAGRGDDERGDREIHGRWALYVAEAGTGGTGRCAMIRGAMQCAGATGSVSRYYRGQQERIVTGLPSYAPSAPPQAGAGATGPHDVSFEDGRGFVAIGLGGPLSPVAMRALVGDGFGWIVRFRDSGDWSFDTDVAAYEQQNNPDGGVPDSNPYGLLEGAGRRIVVDAGGNSLLRVSSSRQISTIAVFPSRPQGRNTDSVPNSVAVGRDGAFYVGELTGVPFAPASSNVWKVRPGSAPQVHCSGFNYIIDLDFDRRGNLYVLEHSSAPFPTGAGALYRVRQDCSRSPVATGLSNPTSVTIGPDGNAYISNFGTSPAIGEVIRVGLRKHGDDEDDD